MDDQRCLGASEGAEVERVGARAQTIGMDPRTRGRERAGRVNTEQSKRTASSVLVAIGAVAPSAGHPWGGQRSRDRSALSAGSRRAASNRAKSIDASRI